MLKHARQEKFQAFGLVVVRFRCIVTKTSKTKFEHRDTRKKEKTPPTRPETQHASDHFVAARRLRLRTGTYRSPYRVQSHRTAVRTTRQYCIAHAIYKRPDRTENRKQQPKTYARVSCGRASMGEGTTCTLHERDHRHMREETESKTARPPNQDRKKRRRRRARTDLDSNPEREGTKGRQ